VLFFEADADKVVVVVLRLVPGTKDFLRPAFSPNSAASTRLRLRGTLENGPAGIALLCAPTGVT
jgi:hypothetical protein